MNRFFGSIRSALGRGYDLLRRLLGAVAVANPLGLFVTFAAGLVLGAACLAVMNGLFLWGAYTQLGPDPWRDWPPDSKTPPERQEVPLGQEGGGTLVLTAFSRPAGESLLQGKPFLERPDIRSDPSVEAHRHELDELLKVEDKAIVRSIRRYEVQKLGVTREKETDVAYRGIMVLEVRQETRADAEVVVADLGCYYVPGREAGTPPVSAPVSADPTAPVRPNEDGAGLAYEVRRIPWWQTKGLAPSNKLVELKVDPRSPQSLFLREIRFDTSPSAITTWIKTYWPAVAKEANLDYTRSNLLKLNARQLEGPVAGGLESLLTRDWGHLRTTPAVVGMRVVNGTVQWLTIAAFFAILLIVAARLVVFVWGEDCYEFPLHSRPGPGGTSWLRKELRLTEQANLQHVRRWGTRSASLGIWRGALNALISGGSYQDVPSFVSALGELQLGRRSAAGFSWRFFIGALPALGFIGTVMGIGDALMGTGSVLSDELAKQQSGVSTVSLALGFAFDTTFVGLALSLVAVFLTSWLTSAEEGVIYDVQHDCLEQLIARSPVQVPPPPAAGPGAGPGSPPPPARALAAPLASPRALRLIDGPDDYSAPVRASIRRGRFWSVVGFVAKLLVFGGMTAFGVWMGLSGRR